VWFLILLIGFYYKRPTAIFANMKAFLVNRVGDFGFILGIGLLLASTGTMKYDRDVCPETRRLHNKHCLALTGIY